MWHAPGVVVQRERHKEACVFRSLGFPKQRVELHVLEFASSTYDKVTKKEVFEVKSEKPWSGVDQSRTRKKQI